MQLHAPFLISARLLPALKVGDCTISLELTGISPEGRTQCVAYFDFDDGRSFEDSNLQSGCCATDTQSMFENLLGFMSACGEALQYDRRSMGRSTAENADLFCPEVAEFCDTNSDELSMLACLLEETPNLIVEE